MSDRLKNMAAVVGGLLVFGTCHVMPARSDYTWVDAYGRRAEGRGWQLAHMEHNLIDIARPWTIVKPPPVGLWYVKATSLTILPGGVRRIDTLRALRSRPPIEESEATALYDCPNRRYAFSEIRERAQIRRSSVPELHPVPAASTPGGAVFQAVCAL